MAAANVFLKTLEEPVADTAFLLLTRSADLLLPTIRSRSQTVTIAPQKLESDANERRQLVRIRADAESAGGDAAEAEKLARLLLAAVASYASRGDTGALLRAAAIVGSSDDPRVSFTLLASVLRDCAGLPPEETIEPEAVRAIREKIGAAALLGAADLALKSLQRLALNADTRLMAEESLLAIARK